MLSVPWSAIDEALAQAGSLDGTIVIDTTNQFGPNGVQELPGGISAAEYNQRRIPQARLVKAYNTLTAGFQAEAAGRTGPDRVVMFYAGEDAAAKRVVAQLIDDSGFAPVDLGGWATVRYMEAPRRPGAVYGEEYHLAEARAFVASVTGCVSARRTTGPAPGRCLTQGDKGEHDRGTKRTGPRRLDGLGVLGGHRAVADTVIDQPGVIAP
jgi:hypothetical protein